MTTLAAKGKSLVAHNADFSDSKIGYSNHFGIYPIFAPADWKLENEQFNLVKAYNDSRLIYKRFAFMVSDNATTLTLTINFYNWSGNKKNTVHYYEEIDGDIVEQSYTGESTTTVSITFTEGSTNRFVIVTGSFSTSTAQAPTISFSNNNDFITWLHIGDTIENIASLVYNKNIRVITTENSSGVPDSFLGSLQPNNGGVLDFPESVGEVGSSYAGQISAVVFHSTDVPTAANNNPFGGLQAGVKVFVPDSALSAYQEDWSYTDPILHKGTYDRLTPLSEYRREDYITQS